MSTDLKLTPLNIDAINFIIKYANLIKTWEGWEGRRASLNKLDKRQKFPRAVLAAGGLTYRPRSDSLSYDLTCLDFMLKKLGHALNGESYAFHSLFLLNDPEFRNEFDRFLETCRYQ